MSVNLFFLFLFLTPFLFGEAQESSLEVTHPTQFPEAGEGSRDPSLLVCGIHLFSGHYAAVVEDMRTISSVPLRVERSFAGPTFGGNLGGGWNWNWKGSLSFFEKKSKHHHTHYRSDYKGPHGMIIHFDERRRGRKEEENLFFMVGQKGETNGSSWYLSGQKNSHNISLFFSEKFSRAILKNGSGDEKVFHCKGHSTRHRYYLLDREELACRQSVKYEHNRDKRINRVSIRGQGGEELFAMAIDYPKKMKEHPYISAYDCVGRMVTYRFGRHKFKPETSENSYDEYTLQEVIRPDLPNLHYAYHIHDEILSGLVRRISQPDGRVMELHYYNKEKTTLPESGEVVKIDKQDYRLGKVKKVKAPIGSTAELNTMATFRYDRIGKKEFHEAGITHVWDAHGKKKSYEHDDLRLKTIHFWGEHNKTIEAREKFIWSKTAYMEGDLLCRYVEDGAGRILLAREYLYDDRHNVIEERLWGNLTGINSAPIQVSGEGKVQSSSDCQRVQFRYSDDGRNLVLYEKRGDLEIESSYYPHSSLLSKRIERDRAGLFRSYSYEYDTTSKPCREVVEDESGFRQETKIRNNRLGLPEEIEYIGSGTLRKELLRYSDKGLLIEKKGVGPAGELLSIQSFNYDSKGNCIYERDPLGQEIHRTYDANNNLLSERGPDPRIEKRFCYDFMNRLIEAKELHPEGIRTKHFRHTALLQKGAEIDFRGHEQKFVYDWQDAPFAVIMPTFMSEEGAISYTAFEQHNFLGHLVKKIACNGAVTLFDPNILGYPTKVYHPDGSQEQFGYDTFGKKLFHVEKGGLRHEYAYDGFGRLTSEKLFDIDGTFLSEMQKRYSGLRLVQEIDTYGIVTTYTYNAAGLLSRKQRGEQVEENSYDPLGRLLSVTTPLFTKEYAYDALNRIIEEKTLSPDGEVQEWLEYAFDLGGNQCRIVRHQESLITTEITYDTFGRITHKKEGSQEIHVQYLDDFINGYGEKVEKKIITAADGLTTEIEHDPLGREVLFVKKDLLGKILQKKRHTYDALSQITKTEETLYYQEKEEKVLVNTFIYSQEGQLLESTEAAGTPERKKFSHEYFKGRKVKTIKPDGVALYFDYDAMGKMRTLLSSDGTINYQYEYDNLSRLTQIVDKIAGTIIHRSYDQEENLLAEEFPDYTISYTYDGFDRLSQVNLMGGSWSYRYKGNRLAAIQRERPKGTPYEVQFTKYDAAGELKAMQLLGKGGTVTYSHDSEGTFTGFSHPLFSDTITSFDASKRPKELLRTINDKETLTPIRYDSLGQVTQTGDRSYQFDSLYNLREEGGKSYSYNHLNQRTDLAYDPSGNLIAVGDTQYAYDALDRLTSVTTGNGTYHYTYDGLHRRLSDGKRSFIYQGECEIGALQNNRLTELRLLHSAATGETGSTVAIEIDDRAYSPLTDSFGHIAALLDEEGTLVESEPFSPFGKDLSRTGLHPWRFSSKRLDPQTGLVFFGQRYYSIDLMRWLTPDPLSFQAGSNLYAYVNNNPVQQIDAFGLFSEGGGSCQWIWGLISHFLGECMENIGRNWLPIPLIRDAVEYTGRLLQGRGLEGWSPSFRRDHSRYDCTIFGDESQRVTNKAIYYINGMDTTYEAFMNNVNRIAADNPGVPVYYTYNGTKGIITDLLECAMQKLGIATPPIYIMRDHVKEIFAGKGDDFTLLLIAHSQGGIITSNVGQHLSPDITSRIDVRTFGSGTIITDNRWRSAVNYVSSHDPVPILASPGIFFKHALSKSPSLVILPRKSESYFDHDFAGPTYSGAVNGVISNYFNNGK